MLGARSAQARGLDYLYGLRQGLPEPDWVSLMLHPLYRDAACAWIGEHVQALNAALLPLLMACHKAVAPLEPPELQLFAAPLDPRFALDGVCLLPAFKTAPTRILLDLGVLDEPHWLALLAHEYTHALLAAPGHDLPFQQMLSTLCRHLHLELYGCDWQTYDWQTCDWQTLPLYPRRPDRLAFWRGQR